MDKSAKILVTGGHGMVGRALSALLKKHGYSNVTLMGRSDCELTDRKATHEFFAKARADYVFHLASKVGGIQANMSDPVGFLSENVLVNAHVLEACHKTKIKRTLVLGSSCIYPRLCPQPMREEYLLTGPVEPTNEGYALSKIVALKLAKYYETQYQMRSVSPMPCNLYGPGDTFDFEKGHVLSALVRRFIEAKRQKASTVTLWGTGSAKREFLHVDDCVEGILFCMLNVPTADIINLGSGVDHSIKELAEMVRQEVGYSGEILWDPSRPDGMPRKCLDVTKLSDLGFKAKIDIQTGIRSVISDFESRFPQ